METKIDTKKLRAAVQGEVEALLREAKEHVDNGCGQAACEVLTKIAWIGGLLEAAEGTLSGLDAVAD